jgi:hypothetical protein
VLRRTAVLVVLVAVAASACGGGTAGPFGDGAFAFSASSDLAIGTERLLVAVSDPAGTRLADPSIPVTVTLWPEVDVSARQTVPTTFAWAIPNVSGLYEATVQFDRDGLWDVRVTPQGADPLDDFTIMVNEAPSTPAVGDPAPRSDTPTLADHDVAEISTDPDPDPRFYEMSVADAVTSGRPTVIVFSTPKFCQTGICGPTLDTVKAAAADHPDVNFIHVEVYTNLDDPANLQLVPAVIEWGLPTEPWTFVVDAAGLISARFEGVVTSDEISAALEG